MVVGVGSMFFLIQPPPPTTGLDVFRSRMPLVIVSSAGLVVVTIAWYFREFGRRSAAIIEGASPSDRQLRLLGTTPRATAINLFVIGMAFDTLVVTEVWLTYRWLDWPRVFASGIVTVSATALVAYLVVERALGEPLAAVSLDVPVPALGVVGRLVAIWAVAVSTPLAALMIAPHRVALNGAQWVILAVGLSICLAGLIIIGHNITQPIKTLRRALQRVEGGELDVGVVPDDGGELGQLQHAFNDMVHGLRQRDRLATLFGAHVGADVAERAMAGHDQLGGESVEVTALFVDIDGSTELAQTLPPDEFVIMLNGFYGVVVEVVTAEGGLVNKFEGDAALAVFGAPTIQSDHADRALRAARTLRERLAALCIVSPDSTPASVWRPARRWPATWARPTATSTRSSATRSTKPHG